MPSPTQPRYLRLLRALTFLALTASLLYAAIGTLHWPIVGDAPLLHYNVFLFDHGFTPYRQVIDMDFPGVYALQSLAIHLYGPGPLAWRFFDFTLLLVIGACMVLIARPNDWLAGYFAATLFALLHFRDGPTHTGQRDLMMTALLLPAITALFHATRSFSRCSHPPAQENCHPAAQPKDLLLTSADTTTTTNPIPYSLLPLPFFLLGLATLIKPSALFFALTLLTLLWLHLGLNTPRIKILAIAKSAFWLPLILCALYLHHIHALAAFITIIRGIDVYHASLGRHSLPALVIGSFPTVLLAVFIPALPFFFTKDLYRNWTYKVLLACTLLGCLSYILQGKGYPYHRYPTEAFLLLLIALLVFPHLQAQPRSRNFAILTLLLGAFFLAPASASIAVHFDASQEFNNLLASDLTALNKITPLDRHIQCLDDTAGCISTLYNLQLVQATGTLYDCYLFQPQPSPIADQLRATLWSALAANPPSVLVVTNQQCFTFNRNFDHLANWPQFTTLLQTNYTLIAQRTPPDAVGWWRHPAQPFSYRIYLAKPSAELSPETISSQPHSHADKDALHP